MRTKLALACFLLSTLTSKEMETKVVVTAVARGLSVNEVVLLVEHQCPLKDFDERGFEISIAIEKCRIRGFFPKSQTIFIQS